MVSKKVFLSSFEHVLCSKNFQNVLKFIEKPKPLKNGRAFFSKKPIKIFEIFEQEAESFFILWKKVGQAHV